MPTSPAREGSDTADVEAAVKRIRTANGLAWACDARMVADALAASEAARQEAREELRAARIWLRQGYVTHTKRIIDTALAALDSGHQEGGA